MSDLGIASSDGDTSWIDDVFKIAKAFSSFKRKDRKKSVTSTTSVSSASSSLIETVIQSAGQAAGGLLDAEHLLQSVAHAAGFPVTGFSSKNFTEQKKAIVDDIDLD